MLVGECLLTSNYYRYGTIAEHSVGHVSAELFETELMPLLLEKAMVDPVPNVRITAARAMKKLSEHGTCAILLHWCASYANSLH